MVLALQSTTLDINTNVGLKIMNGLRWHLVEDGYLGIGKHCRKWMLFGHCQSGTSFTNCCSEQNRKMNIVELFLN